MDPFMSLIGAVPQEEEAQAALAQQLRKQQGLGQILQLSGDKVLSPIGGSMDKGSLAQAEQIGKNRMVQDQQRGLSKWRESQAAYQDKSLEASERMRMAQLEATSLGRQAREDHYQENMDYKKAKESRTSASKIGKLISDDGIAESVPMIHALRSEVKRYMDEGKDVPGVSVMYRLPGAQSLSGALSGDSERIIQRKAQVMNPILKARSGAAVTDPELKRLIDEVEGARSEQGLLDGLDGLESYLKAMADNHINSNSYGREEYIRETGIGGEGYWEVGASPKDLPSSSTTTDWTKFGLSEEDVAQAQAEGLL